MKAHHDTLCAIGRAPCYLSVKLTAVEPSGERLLELARAAKPPAPPCKPQR